MGALIYLHTVRRGDLGVGGLDGGHLVRAPLPRSLRRQTQLGQRSAGARAGGVCDEALGAGEAIGRKLTTIVRDMRWKIKQEKFEGRKELG